MRANVEWCDWSRSCGCCCCTGGCAFPLYHKWWLSPAPSVGYTLPLLSSSAISNTFCFSPWTEETSLGHSGTISHLCSGLAGDMRANLGESLHHRRQIFLPKLDLYAFLWSFKNKTLNRWLRRIPADMTAMGKFKHILLIFAGLITAANGKFSVSNNLLWRLYRFKECKFESGGFGVVVMSENVSWNGQ